MAIEVITSGLRTLMCRVHEGKNNIPLVCFCICNNSIPIESCDADQFRCTNEQCIPAKARCDDNFECLDYSDEVNCIFVQPCPEALYRCETGKCVDNKAKCTSSESVMSSTTSFVDDQLFSTVTAYIHSQTFNFQSTPMLISTEFSEKLHASSFILEVSSYPSSLKQMAKLIDSFSSYITSSTTSHAASGMYSYFELYSTPSTTSKLSRESDLLPTKCLTSLVSLSTLQPTTTIGQLSDITSSYTDKHTTKQTHINSNFIASSMTIAASKSINFEASELDLTTNNHSHLHVFVNSSIMVSSKPLQSVTSTHILYSSLIVSSKSVLHTSEGISVISAAEPSSHTSLYTTLPSNKFISRDVLASFTTPEQHRTIPLNDLFESTSSNTEHSTIKTTPPFESTIPEDKKDNDTAFPYWVIAIITVIILIAMTTLYIIYRHYVRKRTRKKEFGSITSMDMVHPDIVPKNTKPKSHEGMIKTSSFNRVQQYN
ncbi:uncharacterized protein LOC143075061 isoform X1 [Mytilus galloprovincialis]|uniref:uncharacterized protein LOC143075061 isoform X1 n=2 Tax=Mytilus galloprovincialis TaxID=29158 RepID=UPI003F7B3782